MIPKITGIKKLPKGADAMAIVVVMLFVDDDPPKYKIRHEFTHIKQQWRWLIIPFFILYFCSKNWRYKFELEAYRVSVRHGLPLKTAAQHLSGPLYGNMVSYRQALKALQN